MTHGGVMGLGKEEHKADLIEGGGALIWRQL
jgi:hypothetical protein